MNISFKIDCASHEEEIILVVGSIPELGEWEPEKGLILENTAPHQWEGHIEVENLPTSFEYRYCKKRSKKLISESGEKRSITQIPSETNVIRLRDFWRPEQEEDIVWRSNAFKNILTRRVDLLQLPKTVESKKILRIQINGTTVEPMYTIGIVGNTEQLGNNEHENYKVLSNINYPYWHIDVDASTIEYPIEYKYVLIHRRSGKLERIEEGENRLIRKSGCTNTNNYFKVHTDDKFRETEGPSKLAGLCVGLWQLRTKTATGCGDLMSLKPLINWCHQNGHRIIQLLPINSIHTPLRPERIYPFEIKSAYAINPMLANLTMVEKNYKVKIDEALKTELKVCNQDEIIDFVLVEKLKLAALKQVFNSIKESLVNSSEMKSFIDNNKQWLFAYAVFETLHKTKEWSSIGKYSEKKMNSYFEKENEYSFELNFHLFVQFILYQQLKEVTNYARNYGIILDIEISTTVHTQSVEAWQYPNYFDKKSPVGVLPNSGGQIDNQWDIASCSWQSMKRKKYIWWDNLFSHFGNYFDACRLSDIGTVLRTWHVPNSATQSRLGYYQPALSYSTNELIEQEFWYDDSMTKPYIREYFLEELFGDETEQIKQEFFNEYETGKYEFKERFATQRQIFQYFAPRCSTEDLDANEHRLLFGLLTLHREVLFIKDEEEIERVHPRVNFEETYAFINLPEDQRAKLMQICSDYYENRHDQLWIKEATTSLRSLSESCKMLLSVDDVRLNLNGQEDLFQKLGILTEAVQRISKHNQYEFISINEIPYLSILYSSNPKGESLTQWWKNNPIDSKRLAKHLHLSEREETDSINSWMLKEIIQRQWESVSFAVLLTIQDLLNLGNDYPMESTNNHPLVQRNLVTIEELLLNEELNQWVVSTLKNADRFI